VPTILLVALLRIVMAGVNAFVRRERAPKPKPLCAECAFAHIQYGVCGRRAISCTFAGGIREMKLDVLYCTDYRSRSLPPRPGIGFVQILEVE
jgi:hypothetical protein